LASSTAAFSRKATATWERTFPIRIRQAFFAPTCVQDNCPSIAAQGVTLQAGLLPATDGGQLQTFISQPGFHSIDPEIKPPYTMTYSLGVQQQISPNMSFTMTYVGNLSRHWNSMPLPILRRVCGALEPIPIPFNPFPDLGGIGQNILAA
jgi:hypothetical protein